MRKTSLLVLVFFAVAAAAWAGTITVTSPRGGDVLCRGRTYQIRWTSSGIGDRVMVQLVHSSGLATYLARDTKNTGLFDYTVPNTITEGNYTVAVLSGDGRVRGESGTFRIDPCLVTAKPLSPSFEIVPSITVGYMHERGVYSVGGFSEIRWTTRGHMPEVVNITLHPPGCTGVGTYLSAPHTSSGSQWLRFPTTIADGYYSIRVGEFPGSLCGCSGRIHLRRELIVTEPNSGTVWHPGESVVVRWRRERPCVSPRIAIIVVPDVIPPRWGWYELALEVAETACELRATLPGDLPPGRYAVCLSHWGRPTNGRGDGPESDVFQVVAR